MDILIFIVSIITGVVILYLIFKSPFNYPYFEYYLDVSGKRNPDINNLIDNFLNEKNIEVIKEYEKSIKL